MNEERPNYEMFLVGGKDSYTREIIQKLVPGIPEKFARGNAAYLVKMAKDQGIIIKARKFGSDVWICRIKDEDISKVTRQRNS